MEMSLGRNMGGWSVALTLELASGHSGREGSLWGEAGHMSASTEP